MTDSVRWRLRPDLLWETVHTASGLMHVVKDPVAGRFFHFDPREFAILRLLDEERTPGDMLAAVRQSRPDEFFSTEALLRFLAEARRSGLLLLRGGRSVAEVDGAPRSRRFWSALSWKLPLFNPAGLIAALRPLCAALLSPLAIALWMIALLSAVGLMITRFDDVAARWPAAEAWSTPSMAVTIVVVLLACKIVHELAHALVADRFGVRVQECGVMLFYFMPCFYCDVSDAWLLRSARKRILISAAGMLAELGLAAVAAWLWWFSHPGPIQSICLAVMATCSINTLLINGNPLLRFDGYFVLVDLLGLPNLASRGAAWWNAAWERAVYAIPRDVGTDRENLALATYGAASFAYRLIVLAGMLWAIHAILDARGAGALSAVLAMVVAAGLVQGGARFALRPLRDSLLRRTVRPSRTAATMVVLAGLFSLAAFIPLPQSVQADFVVEPASSQSVFIQTPGILRSLLPAGTAVKTGEIIAVLEDFETTRRLAELESRKVVAERRLESARVRRTVEEQAGREIPALVESLAAIEERLLLARRTARELQVASPCDGILLPPPNSPRTPSRRQDTTYWRGTPFDAENLGCTLRQGTCLAIVSSSRAISATACVSQRKIELVRSAQNVRLAIDGMAGDARTGIVEEISPAPIEELPRELVATRRTPTMPSPDRSSATPLEPMYRVRIRLDDPSLRTAIGSLGTARITCDRASIAARTLSLLAETFRIDL
ncbi:Peptidase family M50 [Caulifigura coniformis]|uniref:Peptidase family M50 n=1 Tax=Caulifigura coniformis TaxID=2527983 RepID=A0A517S7M2_9PLAN|nr:site-2 protease family protein [Caulifigura coniformis]QDT52115.1 Peptidase family M50 [Caulifigura coniformis]